MQKRVMMGTVRALEGQADAMEAVLRQMVVAAGDEPGVEVYSYHRSEDDTFWFFALMTDQNSMRDHGQSDAMQAAMDDFKPLMAAPPEMTMAVPIAAVGLDL